MQRRDFIILTASASLIALAPEYALSQSDGLDYEDFQGPLPTYRLYGTNPATGSEEKMARSILDAAPKGKSLIETARYFESISEKNSEGESYNAQWKKRWNPVIVGFYQSTTLGQDYVYRKGDTIDWCAAFINWCLARSGYETTKNAMSGSFRLGKGLGKSTNSPNEGDIIVFKKRNPKEAKVGFGHVGIYVDKTEEGYHVLGGNQKNGKKFSSVNTTLIRFDNKSIEFDSTRDIGSISRKA